MTERVLLNISNHPSSNWGNEQKDGWDVIIDIPFPPVDPHLDTHDKPYQDMVKGIKSSILHAIIQYNHIYLFLAGEFSLCYSILQSISKWVEEGAITLIVPTTERVVQETLLPNGTIKKESIFRFVRWRVI